MFGLIGAGVFFGFGLGLGAPAGIAACEAIGNLAAWGLRSLKRKLEAE